MRIPCIRFLLATGMAVGLLLVAQPETYAAGQTDQPQTGASNSSYANPNLNAAGAPLDECTLEAAANGYAGCDSVGPAANPAITNTTAFKAARSDAGKTADTALDPFGPYATPAGSGLCRYIDNVTSATSGSSVFIPFNSLVEWNDFLGNVSPNYVQWLGTKPTVTTAGTHCVRAYTFVITPGANCLAPQPTYQLDAEPYMRWSTADIPVSPNPFSFYCSGGSPVQCDANDTTLCTPATTTPWTENVSVVDTPLDSDTTWNAATGTWGPSWTQTLTRDDSGLPNPAPAETYVASCPTSCGYGGGTGSCVVSQNGFTVDPSYCANAGVSLVCPATGACVVGTAGAVQASQCNNVAPTTFPISGAWAAGDAGASPITQGPGIPGSAPTAVLTANAMCADRGCAGLVSFTESAAASGNTVWWNQWAGGSWQGQFTHSNHLATITSLTCMGAMPSGACHYNGNIYSNGQTILPPNTDINSPSSVPYVPGCCLTPEPYLAPVVPYDMINPSAPLTDPTGQPTTGFNNFWFGYGIFYPPADLCNPWTGSCPEWICNNGAIERVSVPVTPPGPVVCPASSGPVCIGGYDGYGNCMGSIVNESFPNGGLQTAYADPYGNLFQCYSGCDADSGVCSSSWNVTYFP